MSEKINKAELYKLQPGFIAVEFEPPIQEIKGIYLPDSAKGYRHEAKVLAIGAAKISSDPHGNRVVEEPPIGLKVGDWVPLNENWVRDKRIQVGEFEDGSPDYIWFAAFRDVWAVRNSEAS